MSNILADFMISNPKTVNLNNVIGYNDTDYYYRQFYKDLSTNDPKQNFCSQTYSKFSLSSPENISNSIDIITKDISGSECDIKTEEPEITTCYKKSLCLNAALHNQQKKLQNTSYNATDVHYTDMNRQQNFHAITVVNLSLGIILLGITIYKYY